MGGSVTVAFRFPDGETIAQKRWTNPLPYWFARADFLRGDRAVLDQYLQAAEDPTPKRMVPGEYGIVVMDLVTNTLLSMQHYTSFGLLHPVHIVRSQSHDEVDEDYLRLLTEGRLHPGVRYRDGRIERGAWPEGMEMTWEALCRHARAEYDREERENPRDAFFTYVIDLAPMTLVNFDTRDKKSRKAFLDHLDRIGFPISEADRAAWESE